MYLFIRYIFLFIIYSIYHLYSYTFLLTFWSDESTKWNICHILYFWPGSVWISKSIKKKKKKLQDRWIGKMRQDLVISFFFFLFESFFFLLSYEILPSLQRNRLFMFLIASRNVCTFACIISKWLYHDFDMIICAGLQSPQ